MIVANCFRIILCWFVPIRPDSLLRPVSAPNSRKLSSDFVPMVAEPFWQAGSEDVGQNIAKSESLTVFMFGYFCRWSCVVVDVDVVVGVVLLLLLLGLWLLCKFTHKVARRLWAQTRRKSEPTAARTHSQYRSREKAQRPCPALIL